MKENTVHYAKGRARKKEGGLIYALIQFREREKACPKFQKLCFGILLAWIS